MESTKYAFTSWSSYDAQRRQSTSDETSPTTTSPPSSTKTNDDPLLKTIEKHHKHPKKPTPLGIEALYQPSTPGIDTQLQLQWMRVHPSVVFPFCSDSGDSSAVEMSGFVTQPSEENGLNCTVGGFEVDLTELITPPLLVSWLPGVDTNCSYDCDSEEESSRDDDEEDRLGGNNETIPTSLCQEAVSSPSPPDIPSILQALREAALSQTNTSHERNSHMSSLLQPLKQLSTDSLSEVLPSHMLHHQTIQSPNHDDSLSVSISTLHLLSKYTQSESMGKYIICILSPVLLRCQSFTEKHQELIREMAYSLISDCHLGYWKRLDLLQLFDMEADDEGDMEVLDELRCCVSEAYFSWNG